MKVIEGAVVAQGARTSPFWGKSVGQISATHFNEFKIRPASNGNATAMIPVSCGCQMRPAVPLDRNNRECFGSHPADQE